MNYEIIKNPEELKAFIDWLPELTDKNKYYVSLFARNKYNGTPGLKADKQQLKRFLTCKKRMFNKIQQLEVKKGLYMVGDIEINEESLALYISLNPRNMIGSTAEFKFQLAEAEKNGKVIDNISDFGMNVIQNTSVKGRGDWDLDLTKLGLLVDRGIMLESVKENLSEIINLDAVAILETHGGFHLLIDAKLVAPEFQKTWFQKVCSLGNKFYKIQKNNSDLIPVPGCIQGGRYPKMRSL